MPRLTVLAVLVLALALAAPPDADAKKIVRGSEWDVRVETKTTYVYDQAPYRDEVESTRKGTGSVTAVVTGKNLVIPRRRVALGDRYDTRLEGRQNPGSLTYTAGTPGSTNEQRCEGKLTNGGGETVYGDDAHEDPLPRKAERAFAVTKEGITIGFGLLGRYDRCLFQGGEMGLPTSERAPFAFTLPGAAHARKSYRLKAVGWQAYASCGEQDDFEGSGEPPATVGTGCRPDQMTRQEITVELTRRCALTTTVIDGSFSYTNCGASTRLPGS